MIRTIDEGFWEKEDRKLWELFQKLQKAGKKYSIPMFVEQELGREFKTLHDFFISMSLPNQFSPEEKVQHESRAKDLRYDSARGVCAWYKNRLKEKKRNFYHTYTRPRNKVKKEGEIDCVKRFYKNNGQRLEDSQIEPKEENSPIDVTVIEEGKEANFQVTLLRRQTGVALLRWGMVCGEKKPEEEEIEEINGAVRNAINDKEPKSSDDVILLLCTFFPPTEKGLFKRAIDGLSIVSSFREIYIVTLDCNIPVKCL